VLFGSGSVVGRGWLSWHFRCGGGGEESFDACAGLGDELEVGFDVAVGPDGVGAGAGEPSA